MSDLCPSLNAISLCNLIIPPIRLMISKSDFNPIHGCLWMHQRCPVKWTIAIKSRFCPKIGHLSVSGNEYLINDLYLPFHSCWILIIMSHIIWFILMVDYMGHNGQYSFHTGSVKCKIIILLIFIIIDRLIVI